MTALAEWVRWIEEAVNPLVFPFALLAGLVLAGVTLSFFALARAKGLALAAREHATAAHEKSGAALACLQERLDALAVKLEEVGRQARAVPSAPKPGFNLTKRSQALRVYRRGEPPDQIAAALDLPLQEVDLLLKVHRVVIRNL
ncbi:MAG TPA: hypothetical protein VE959_38685 [Bryobacteraceae bacterium]|nr:hypothetical protein [Bryobacteraceae bacterium]